MGSSWVKFRTHKCGLQARFQTQNMARTSPYTNVSKNPPPKANEIFFSRGISFSLSVSMVFTSRSGI